MKKSKKDVLQFTHKDLADIVDTGVFQVEHIDLQNGRCVLEGMTVDADGRPVMSFSLPCNPTKFYAKMAERSSEPALITPTIKTPRRSGKSKKSSTDEPSKSKGARRRVRHPITKKLVAADEAHAVKEAIRVGGPQVEAKLLNEFKTQGTVTLPTSS